MARYAGKQKSRYLIEPRGPKIRRRFNLSGYWQGPDLALHGHKSTITYFRPGGTLTPSGGYTSPLPDKPATARLSWGGKGEFESLWVSISHAATRSP